MNSREITLWLDGRWYDALSRQLKGETVEDKLNEHLDELINALIPDTEYSRISTLYRARGGEIVGCENCIDALDAVDNRDLAD